MQSGISQIKTCRSTKELAALWESNVREWSQLPKDRARELIDAKNRRKAELSFDDDMERAIRRIDRRWDHAVFTMRDVPEETRRRCFELEKQMTDHANAGNFNAA